MIGSKGRFFAVAPLEDRFSPLEKYWHIPFSLVSTGGHTSVASLQEVKVNGNPLPREQIVFLEGDYRGLPVLPAGRYLSEEELVEWHRSRLLSERGRRLSPMAALQLSAGNSKLSFLAEKVPAMQEGANEMALPASSLGLKTGESYLLEVLFGDRSQNTFGFHLAFTVTALSHGGHRWVGGDMHIHSHYSDGRRSLPQLKTLMKERGYHFLYLSDGHHSKRLRAGDWPAYRRETREISDRDLSLFPGIETAAGTPQDEKGHLQDFTVFGHRGMEIMSGPLQFAFGLQGAPARLWRREVKRHLDRALETRDFPSPFTGTDWHGYWFEPLRGYVTWTYLSCDWDGLDYTGRKRAVDQSLFAGRVAASRRGSLGFFRLGGRDVGSVLRHVPAGTALPLAVEFRPACRGLTHLYVLQGNMEKIVFRQKGLFYPGQASRWQDSLVFPGGRQFYWLYAAGSDHVYTSPIFVSQD